MLKQIAFPEWTPDLANNVLTQAINVRAIANGYAPIKGFEAITPSIGDEFNGGGAFIDSTGLSTFLGANEEDILEYDGANWNAAGLTLTQEQVNRFAQFGDNVIIATGDAADLISYDLITDATTTPTDAPNAIDVAQVRDFVMCITMDNKVRWCQFNNSSVWTLGANQADEQPILSSSGVRLVGGEYAILLKKQGITRITYVGSVNDTIFQFDEIAPEIGCMAGGSVCNVGRLVFFLSERGFEMCDGESVTPIGDEKFNRWFFGTYSREDIAGIWAAVDPRNSQVLWAMPGTPGRIIIYNWVLKRATVIQCDVKGLFTAYTAATSLDALDAIYGDLDSVTVSLDDASLQGGSPLLMVANAANALGSLTGDNLEATFEMKNVEPSPGRRSRMRGLRLVSDTPDASATLDSRLAASDAESLRSTGLMRSNGKLPIRANGRYNTLKVTIPAGTRWTYIQGCEFEFEAGDGR